MGLAESDRRARSNSAQPVKGPGARLSNGLQCQRNDGVGRAAPHQGVHARAAPHRGMKTELSVARGDLSQAQWQVLEEVLPPVKPTGRRPRGRRQVINEIRWRVRTGAPWRDIPERYEPWEDRLLPVQHLAARRHLG